MKISIRIHLWIANTDDYIEEQGYYYHPLNHSIMNAVLHMYTNMYAILYLVDSYSISVKYIYLYIIP